MIPPSSGLGHAEGTDLVSPNLSLVGYMLKQIKDDAKLMKTILKDIKAAGYDIRGLEVIEFGGPTGPPTLRVFERHIDFPIDQPAFSRGMFRVIAIIITLNYLLSKIGAGTIVVDDLCEGLDFSRSISLASLLFDRLGHKDVQLIATTNDRFLMGAVDIRYWNIFERHGKHVRSFSYHNSKDAFDEFKLTGMNNFDFFANELYKGFRSD